MASAEIVLACGLKVRVGCQDRLCVNSDADSSVARGGGGGAIAPSIGMSTKMQNGKNTAFLALLRLFYALEWTK